VAEGELDAKDQSWFVSVDTIFQEIGALRNLRKMWIEGIPTLGYKRVAADFAKTVLPNLAVLILILIPALGPTKGNGCIHTSRNNSACGTSVEIAGSKT
jgi:hypothetical protein